MNEVAELRSDQELERLVEDLVIKVAQKEKQSLWSHFVPQHLKLHLAKAMINYTVPRLNRLVPDRKPDYPISKIVDRTFTAFEAMIKDQEKHGPINDRNFRNLVKTLRRTLIFISEEDIYYRGWLHILFLVLYMEVKANLSQLAVTQNVTVK